MAKVFNIVGDCRPNLHYMVDMTSRLEQIRKMVDRGDYFTINRARQYGKTTTLRALKTFLREDYDVVSLDFQMMSTSKFRTEDTFCAAFALDFIDAAEGTEGLASLREVFLLKEAVEHGEKIELFELFRYLSRICKAALRPVVLLIDEVDSAANNQIFMDFLAQLRGYYLNRDTKPTFHSVILAGVYDIRNMKQKLRPDTEHKRNSPWNISAEYRVKMSFSADEAAGMLREYEMDYHSGMDIEEMAGLIYDYTSGYPYLVSCLCKNIHEKVAGTKEFPDRSTAWTREGFMEAVKLLINDNNTLFQSLIGKLDGSPVSGS